MLDIDITIDNTDHGLSSHDIDYQNKILDQKAKENNPLSEKEFDSSTKWHIHFCCV
jgi:hypothetical protein